MSQPGADATQAAASGAATTALSFRELFDLSAYWLAINLLWGALGISLLPLLMVQLVCGGSSACAHPAPIVGSFAPGKGVAEAIIVNAGLLVAILVQPTAAAVSDYASTRWGRRKPFIFAGTLLDLVFLAGLYVAGAWIGVFVFYVLLQCSSNLAQGPFQGYLPDLVPTDQTTTLRRCIGSARFGIEPHEATVEDFPRQPSQKDGLGRMCRTHWNVYTAGLARDAKARKAAASAGIATPEEADQDAAPAEAQRSAGPETAQRRTRRAGPPDPDAAAEGAA